MLYRQYKNFLLWEKIEKVQIQIDQAKRSYDLNKAAELEFGKLGELQRELAEQEIQLKQQNSFGDKSSLCFRIFLHVSNAFKRIK